VARGFDSKDVEYQQAEAARQAVPRRTLTPEERAQAERRRTIELALTRARAERESATVDRHREMLGRAITDLERQLKTEV